MGWTEGLREVQELFSEIGWWYFYAFLSHLSKINNVRSLKWKHFYWTVVNKWIYLTECKFYIIVSNFLLNIYFFCAGEKPHQCDTCNKRFSSTSNLKTHRRLHSGTKPFACDLCQAKFTQLVHLKLHKRLHTNERPYMCISCGKKYISHSGLR